MSTSHALMDLVEEISSSKQISFYLAIVNILTMCASILLNVTCGVPQGSILGPKLFILYINDICNASSSLKFILFADDTNVFYSGVDIQTICECISRELDKLHVWLTNFH